MEKTNLRESVLSHPVQSCDPRYPHAPPTRSAMARCQGARGRTSCSDLLLAHPPRTTFFGGIYNLIIGPPQACHPTIRAMLHQCTCTAHRIFAVLDFISNCFKPVTSPCMNSIVSHISSPRPTAARLGPVVSGQAVSIPQPYDTTIHVEESKMTYRPVCVLCRR